MSRRDAILNWSVVGVGACLFLISIAVWFTTPGSGVINILRAIVPIVLSFATVVFGGWLRRHSYSSHGIGIIAAGAIVGGVLFALMDFWLLFLVSLDGSLPPEAPLILLNRVGIGLFGTALLTGLYVRLQQRNGELRQLTRRLEKQYESLREQATKLEAQNQRLNQFAQIVSHDLRNPLNVAIGRLELALETGDPEHFDAVERSLDRMEMIISDTLSLAKQGQTVNVDQSVTLSEIAHAAWESVETGDVTLEVTADLELEADKSRLRQAFENLFRNAIDHGGSELSTIQVGEIPNGFYVEDDGDGIPADARDKIFEVGYSTAEDGSGLGMVIVQAIIQAHGWKIEVTDASTGGARFEIAIDSNDPTEAP